MKKKREPMFEPGGGVPKLTNEEHEAILSEGIEMGVVAGEYGALVTISSQMNILINSLANSLNKGNANPWIILRMMADIVRPHVQEKEQLWPIKKDREGN